MSMLASRCLIALAALSAGVALSACGASQQSSAVLPLHYSRSAATGSAAPVLRAFTAGKTPGFRRTAFAYDITLGPDGAMWFTDGGTPAIGRITSSGVVTEFTKGLAAGAKPYSIIPGPDGNLWFSDVSGAIGRVTTSGKIDEFSINGLSKVASPDGIVVGSDGAIWSIGQGPPNLLIRAGLDGTLRAYPTPARYGSDGSLAVDASGNFWMMMQAGENGVMLQRKPHGGFVAHHTGLVHAATLCCPNFAPKRITIGPDGNPWYTTLYWLRPNQGGNVIATTSASGTSLFVLNKTNVMYTVYPSGIARMGKRVWFVGDDPFAVNGGLWSIDENGTQHGYPIPYNPVQLAADGSGHLWFTAEGFDNPAQIVEATVSP
jgi:streptogramin lyase